VLVYFVERCVFFVGLFCSKMRLFLPSLLSRVVSLFKVSFVRKYVSYICPISREKYRKIFVGKKKFFVEKYVLCVGHFFVCESKYVT